MPSLIRSLVFRRFSAFAVREPGNIVRFVRVKFDFRALADADKADIDPAKAVRLMLANPSMIKRPILTGAGDAPLVGFAETDWAAALG